MGAGLQRWDFECAAGKVGTLWWQVSECRSSWWPALCASEAGGPLEGFTAVQATLQGAHTEAVALRLWAGDVGKVPLRCATSWGTESQWLKGSAVERGVTVRSHFFTLRKCWKSVNGTGRGPGLLSSQHCSTWEQRAARAILPSLRGVREESSLRRLCPQWPSQRAAGVRKGALLQERACPHDPMSQTCTGRGGDVEKGKPRSGLDGRPSAPQAHHGPASDLAP